MFEGQALDAAEFLARHWQQKPLLLRGTSLNLDALPDRQELFALAAQDGVQSRIVYSEDGVHFDAVYDDVAAWDELIAENAHPTLLVSDIEKWRPRSADLLLQFPFIQPWRFDDLMISCAVRGASVGAHTDHYDVFLVQLRGRREWHYDDAPLADAQHVQGGELEVLADYQGQHCAVLEPGDVLYLPPEIPHHGIAMSDDCMTCSIGLRAPSQAEMLQALCDQKCAALDESLRFQDQPQISADGRIGAHEIAALRQLIGQLQGLSDAELARVFGCMVTDYRMLEGPHRPPQRNARQARRNPFSRFAWHALDDATALLFVNGEAFRCAPQMARSLCHDAPIEVAELRPLDEPEGVLSSLFENGDLIAI